MKKSLQFRLALLFSILCLIAIAIYSPLFLNLLNSNKHIGQIPKEGVAENDTKGKVLGNPKNGIEDLKILYKFIQVFRERNGTFPASGARELLPDACRDPKAYGVTACKEVADILHNPDSKYGDNYKHNADNMIPYMLLGHRPDGSLTGSKKTDDHKDAVACTDLYSFRNIRIFPGERSTMNPVGFYLVLWEDGNVTEVPYNQVRYAKKGEGQYRMCFPGQAGVPADALSYDEYYKQVGYTRGPRGGEGQPGESARD